MYGLIIVILIILIANLCFTVAIFADKEKKSSFNNRTQYYTRDEIEKEWRNTKCNKQLPANILNTLVNFPKSTVNDRLKLYAKSASYCNTSSPINSSSNTQINGSKYIDQRYNIDEIKKEWSDTKCDKPLPNSILNTLINTSKPNAKKYIDNMAKSVSYCKLNPNAPKFVYTSSQLDELKDIWNTSGCNGDFPTQKINKLASDYTNYTTAKKNFIQYTKNLFKNTKDDSIATMNLKTSYNECYGPNWTKNDELLNQYNELMN
jgi:hypothetical protein